MKFLIMKSSKHSNATISCVKPLFRYTRINSPPKNLIQLTTLIRIYHTYWIFIVGQGAGVLLLWSSCFFWWHLAKIKIYSNNYWVSIFKQYTIFSPRVFRRPFVRVWCRSVWSFLNLDCLCLFPIALIVCFSLCLIS